MSEQFSEMADETVRDVCGFISTDAYLLKNTNGIMSGKPMEIRRKGSDN